MPEKVSRIIFIGMGLIGLKSCSIESIKLLDEVDKVVIENFTNFILEPTLDIEKTIQSKIQYVTRQDIEENAEEFLNKIQGLTTAILVPGDPFIATTHISLRILAKQKGFETKVVHNTSILSAAASASGLSAYRFGRTATLPFPENKSTYPYDIIKSNKSIDAHTLVLLDLDQPTGRFLSIKQAINQLLELEELERKGIFTAESIVVGLAQLGREKEFIFAGTANELIDLNWVEKGPPQALIICADTLHFAEEEALEGLWGVKIKE
ncbi:MAG: diphthine synthase [Candidatus Hodarchaeales archaeon]